MPNPVGVNQEVLVWLGVTDYLENESQGWKGLTVSVTRPDGTNETLGPFTTDSTGSTGTVYIPNQVGNYTFQTHFPAQWFNWSAASMFDPAISGRIYYKASDSDVVTLVVREEPVPDYPFTALPSEYWTRPIDAQHYTWYTVSGNWLSIPPNKNAVNNDLAPQSSHILWTKPLVLGGLSGGFNEIQGHETGDAYEGKFANSVIIDGRLYYNRYASGFGGGWAQQGIFCVDLRTGEEVWFKNNSRLAFGQTLYWDAWNMHGVFSYIYTTTSTFDMATFTSTTTWNAYDPLTSEYQFSISNIPSTGAMFGASTQLTGSHGEFIIYNIDLAHGWVAKWNSTTAVIGPKQEGDMSGGSWGSAANTQQTFNGNQGYDWNKTLAAGAGNLPGSISAVLEDRVIGSTAGAWAGMGDNPIGIWAFSLDSTGSTLQTLYNTTWAPPKGDLTVSFGDSSLADKVFTLEIKEKRTIYGFNMDTGKQIWGPTDPQAQLQVYGMSGCIVDGRLFSTGYGGVVYCYNVSNGNPLWTYQASDPYNEILWSSDWPLQVCFVAADKIYLSHNEHSPVNPLPRGAPFVCLDVTNGTKLWDIPLRGTSWGGNAIIGDSIIATWDSYDGQVYAVGKGESAITVTGPDIGIPAASSAIIRGTVTDQSPGAKGTPAISDESMDAWMMYQYMQFEKPVNATGVPVSIDTIDPNGNFLHLGDTTSDTSGTYSFRWVPPSDVPGKYTIIASFAGSNSYWPSTAITAVSVDPAAEPTAAPTQASESVADTYIIPMGTAIIVVIIIVGAVLALLMRRRP
ncbi:MAG: PQQ-binding-like beta-propeller repeat protein [Candidatus Bathyarchaeota archaeon]|nr:PQQ-binding-like beta-propeller repeat protein [Candidatus Bathyarchaeota archaeon]